jgi:hypothetical protein
MRFRTIGFALLLSLLQPSIVLAQDEEDEPQPVKSTKYTGTFGVGGGIAPHWLFINTDKLNAALTATTKTPLLTDKGMFLFGGHGYAYIMLIPNLRIGGIGAGGSISAEGTVQEGSPGEIPGETYYQRTTLSTGFGGVTIEYVIPFKRLQLAFGGVLGGGTHSLTLTRVRNESPAWQSAMHFLEYQHVFTCPYFAYQPTASIEYLFSPFTVLSLTGGYYGTSGKTWTMDDAFSVKDMPDISFAGAFVRVELTFGLFIPE